MGESGDTEGKNLAEFLKGFEERLTSLEEKLGNPSDIPLVQRLNKITEYMQKLIGKEFTKRNFEFIIQVLGGKWAGEEKKKIEFILPGGESLTFPTSAEDQATASARRFLNWGREHQQ